MPRYSVCVKTVVTTDAVKPIAEQYGVEVRDVLTGFKYIGEQIGLLESENRADDYLFGFEESYGYLGGSYVRDKDGVYGAFIICEMASYYHKQHITLCERLQQLREAYGVYYQTLYSFSFPGEQGIYEMKSLMDTMRGNLTQIGGLAVENKVDYLYDNTGLPKSNVVKFFLEHQCTVVLRPSGTEPKLKVYVASWDKDLQKATEIEVALTNDVKRMLGKV